MRRKQCLRKCRGQDVAALRNGEHHQDFSLSSICFSFACLLLLSPYCPLIFLFFFFFFSALGEDSPLVAAEFLSSCSPSLRPHPHIPMLVSKEGAGPGLVSDSHPRSNHV